MIKPPPLKPLTSKEAHQTIGSIIATTVASHVANIMFATEKAREKAVEEGLTEVAIDFFDSSKGYGEYSVVRKAALSVAASAEEQGYKAQVFNPGEYPDRPNKAILVLAW